MVTAGEETTWIDPASSIASVTPGDTLRVEMLIQGMLMQSGNDAAYAVAVAAGRVIADDPQLSAREALNTFMEEVNRQLAQHRLAGTHFVTPDGLDAPGHHTTAADMLSIAILATENPTIRHYAGIAKSPVKLAEYQFSPAPGIPVLLCRCLWLKNRLYQQSRFLPAGYFLCARPLHDHRRLWLPYI